MRYLHEVHAGLQWVPEAEEEEEVLVHGQQLRQLRQIVPLYTVIIFTNLYTVNIYLCT
jgi:hypothetical protein